MIHPFYFLGYHIWPVSSDAHQVVAIQAPIRHNVLVSANGKYWNVYIADIVFWVVAYEEPVPGRCGIDGIRVDRETEMVKFAYIQAFEVCVVFRFPFVVSLPQGFG